MAETEFGFRCRRLCNMPQRARSRRAMTVCAIVAKPGLDTRLTSQQIAFVIGPAMADHGIHRT
jgi:hypothetical protein